jgi:hypothetical protein
MIGAAFKQQEIRLIGEKSVEKKRRNKLLLKGKTET